MRSALLMTSPTAFEVSYHINPWMRPAQWQVSSQSLQAQAQHAWWQLHEALTLSGTEVSVIDAVPGMPDLVFPANAAVVLDGKILLSRFANAERRVEEPVFREYFDSLCGAGVMREYAALPAPLIQEGAGDCLWDAHRQMFWVGFGQRSQRDSADIIADYFGCKVQALELIDPCFYHLDVALAVLAGGELLYYPPAFSEAAQAIIRERVAADQRLEVTAEEAMQFNVNAVSIGRNIFLTPTSERLRALLTERGYHLREIDLSPFLLAGGAAACLTLRLDYSSAHHPVVPEEHHHEHSNGSDCH